MTRIVIDTNVFVAAGFNPRSAAARILAGVRDGRFQLIWNEPTLAFRNAKLTTHGLDSWRKVIDANLTAPFIVATQVAARMARRGGGSIVNFSSIASAGNAGQVAYAPDGTVNVAPEYEECRRLASERGIALKAVHQAALAAAITALR